MWASSIATFVDNAGKALSHLSQNIEFPRRIGRDERDPTEELERVTQYLEAVANFLKSSKASLAQEA
jgi:hypothetical protein